jgi:hypothetical protein
MRSAWILRNQLRLRLSAHGIPPAGTGPKRKFRSACWCRATSSTWPLIASSLIIVAVGAWLTVSPLAGMLGFVPLPPLSWLLLAIMLPFYVILTQLVKTWFYRRFGD